jgi:hypothetical protein
MAKFGEIAPALPPDPWGHCSSGVRCKTYMWLVPKYPCEEPVFEAETVAFVPVHVGHCRRHAPTMNGYPIVFVNDWCGDHRLDEAKL